MMTLIKEFLKEKIKALKVFSLFLLIDMHTYLDSIILARICVISADYTKIKILKKSSIIDNYQYS